MTYTEVTGDLFSQDFPALGHGVNCKGVMGAGISGEFRRRWPAMYDAYAERCRAGLLHPGGIFAWDIGSPPDDGELRIYNLATQGQPGPAATLEAITESVGLMLDDMDWAGIPTVGLPRIGAGIGGLAWPDVAGVLCDAAEDEPGIELVVVSLPEAVDNASIIARDGGKCVRCGKPVSSAWPGYSVHHRKLKSAGKDERAVNKILLDGSGTTGCHGWVHGHPKLARQAGYIVSGYRDPASMPALYHSAHGDNQGWQMLTLDGRLEPYGEIPPQAPDS